MLRPGPVHKGDTEGEGVRNSPKSGYIIVEQSQNIWHSKIFVLSVCFLLFNKFNIWLSDYSILLKARHDELIHESITIKHNGNLNKGLVFRRKQYGVLGYPKQWGSEYQTTGTVFRS